MTEGNTTGWWFRGGSGRWFRDQVLPNSAPPRAPARFHPHTDPRTSIYVNAILLIEVSGAILPIGVQMNLIRERFRPICLHVFCLPVCTPHILGLRQK
jgi:hypothetical protein